MWVLVRDCSSLYVVLWWSVDSSLASPCLSPVDCSDRLQQKATALSAREGRFELNIASPYFPFCVIKAIHFLSFRQKYRRRSFTLSLSPVMDLKTSHFEKCWFSKNVKYFWTRHCDFSLGPKCLGNQGCVCLSLWFVTAKPWVSRCWWRQ